MLQPLPKFKYHPDPIATGSVKQSTEICQCCGLIRGYVYTSNVYAEEELQDQLCPWCIADGSAAKKFDAAFSDDYSLIHEGIDQSIVDEVTQRTPGFDTWQQEVWLTHCNDACQFLGDATKYDLFELAIGKGQLVDADDWGNPDFAEMAKYYEPKGSPALYKFRCIHCGTILYGMDCN
ncbi:CbrC family protein [Vacuolonema iberomarrocanum]|uniref:CbrC family protein n=1 Tax=Vacuolonema iberomarrocanum TaxID=3454632 RepID=UPI0019DE2361|nr:CbrC family protein [filamentous cyanobacterium LEGE 07170]